MVTAIYAGSFDPFTNGHLDILKSGTEIFDKIIIAVAYNPQKKSFIPIQDRVTLIQECVKDLKNVEVDSFGGLTVEYAQKHGAVVLLRGLRNAADYEYEVQMAQVNEALSKNIKTVFLNSKPEYSYVSSSAVREILLNNGDVSKMVPKPVCKYLKKLNFEK